jgi:phosphoketolase
MNLLEQLKSVLCDAAGKCCITGSDEDRAIVDRALQHRSKTMSDVMLFGVLKMPYEMAMASELSRFQFYQRVQELVARVEVQPPLPVLAQEVTDAEVEKACHTAYVQHGPKDMRSVLEQFVKSRAAIAAAIASTKEGKL